MKDYIPQALRTNTKLKVNDVNHYSDLLHGQMGLCTESGKFMDSVKKHFFYGEDLDRHNLKEELGGILWYVAILADYLNVSFEELMEANIAKLKARYPDKWSQEKAINRDLDKEAEAMKCRMIEVIHSPHSWIHNGQICRVLKFFPKTGMIEVEAEGFDARGKKHSIIVALFSGQYKEVK